VSLVFALVFLGLAGWWALDRLTAVDLSLGWVAAVTLLLAGATGLVATLVRHRMAPQPQTETGPEPETTLQTTPVTRTDPDPDAEAELEAEAEARQDAGVARDAYATGTTERAGADEGGRHR